MKTNILVVNAIVKQFTILINQMLMMVRYEENIMMFLNVKVAVLVLVRMVGQEM